MKKKIFVFIMCGALLCQPVYATNDENNQSVESIQVNACIQFTEEEAIEYAESIQNAIDSTAEQLENEIILSDDEDKKELLGEYLGNIEDFESEDMFTENGDNTFELSFPLENVEVNIDGENIITNEEGEVDIEDTEIDFENVDLEDIEIADEYENFETEIEENGDTIDCNVNIPFSDFSKGIKEMSDDMSNVEAQTKCKFYKKKSVGSTFGAGAGRCVVCFNTNIVNCNKCDGSATKNYSKVDFALKNSDCSKSVKLGLVALRDRLPFKPLRYYYRYSIYCVQESMASLVDNKEKNAYCNWKKKSGGHVNCSWFNGIGHSEAFHTHVY